MTDKELQLQAQVDRLEQELREAKDEAVSSQARARREITLASLYEKDIKELSAKIEQLEQTNSASFAEIDRMHQELLDARTEDAPTGRRLTVVPVQAMLEQRCEYFVKCNQMLERQLAEANIALSKAAEEREHGEKLKLNEGRREALRWTLEDPKWWMPTALASKTSAEIQARIDELDAEIGRLCQVVPETCFACGQLLMPVGLRSAQERQAEKDDPDAYCEYCGNRLPGRW